MSYLCSNIMCRSLILSAFVLSLSLTGAAAEDNLIAHYALDGDAADSSGNNNHGTVSGANCNSPGKFGNACEFDGINDYIAIPLNVLHNTNHSIAWWAKANFSALGNADVRFLSARNSGGTNYDIRTWSKNPIQFIFGNGTHVSYVTFSNLADDQWYFFTVTWKYDGTRTDVKSYVNGELQSEKFLWGKIPNPDRSFTLGSYATDYFNGSMDEVRIYDQAISDRKIKELAGFYVEKITIKNGFCFYPEEKISINLSSIAELTDYSLSITASNYQGPVYSREFNDMAGYQFVQEIPITPGQDLEEYNITVTLSNNSQAVYSGTFPVIIKMLPGDVSSCGNNICGPGETEENCISDCHSFDISRIQQHHWRIFVNQSNIYCGDDACPVILSPSEIEEKIAENVDMMYFGVGNFKNETAMNRFKGILSRSENKPIMLGYIGIKDPEAYPVKEFINSTGFDLHGNTYMDVTYPPFIKYLSETAQEDTGNYGFNGEFLDNVNCNNCWNTISIEDCEESIMDILKAAKLSAGDNITIINALNTETTCPQSIGNQGSNLLEFADGGLIEHFCYHGISPGRYNTEQELLSYIDILDNYSDEKIILANVQNDRSGIMNNIENLTQLNRYCLSAFLLGKDKKAFYRFGFYGTNSGSGLNFWNKEVHLPIGSPIGKYYKEGGIYKRNYANGIVLVNPSDSADDIFDISLGKEYITYDGSSIDRITLKPKSGVTLLQKRSPGDIAGNGTTTPDGCVNLYDLSAIGRDFGKTSGFNNPNTDITQDGRVDIYDLVVVGGEFGDGCPE